MLICEGGVLIAVPDPLILCAAHALVIKRNSALCKCAEPNDTLMPYKQCDEYRQRKKQPRWRKKMTCKCQPCEQGCKTGDSEPNVSEDHESALERRPRFSPTLTTRLVLLQRIHEVTG